MRRRCASVLALMTLGGGITAACAHAQWQPPQNLTWYWQLQGKLDSSRPVAAYDIDGFDNSASAVAMLHKAGKHVICYVDVGTWERWRPDAKRFSCRSRTMNA